jgi:serine protease Do
MSKIGQTTRMDLSRFPPSPYKTMILNRYLIPISLIITTILTAPPHVDAALEARAISNKEVAAIAKRTVVRIVSSDGEFGSGVIIGRVEKGYKNVYTILTAAHVVRTPNSYRIITPVLTDNSGVRKRVSINIDAKRNINKLPDVDLATVSFESNYTFAIGTIGNSEYADEGSPVYVAGFPKPGKAIKRVAFQFTGGMVSSRLDEVDNDPKERNNGYDLAYTNITRAGMSGGPVFDAAGRIVAIHGQGDRNSQTPGEEASRGVADDEKTGFNLGIPIQTFLKLQPQFSKSGGAKIDKSPVNYQLRDRSSTIGTKHKKFIKRHRTRSDDPPLLDVTKVNEETFD